MASKNKSHRMSSRVLETAILFALPILLHYLIPIQTIIPKPYSYLGIVLMLLGLTFLIWAANWFQKASTGFQLQGGGSVLVTSGPFQYSRNPMYLGMLIWLTGLAVFLGSLIAFLFPILLWLLANFLMIPLEERELERIFGEEYLDYKRRVRRWI